MTQIHVTSGIKHRYGNSHQLPKTMFHSNPPAGASGFDTNFTKRPKHVTSQLISHKYANQTETCLYLFDLWKVSTSKRALGKCLERAKNNSECIWSQWAPFKCEHFIGVTWPNAVQCGIKHHFCQVTWDTG